MNDTTIIDLACEAANAAAKIDALIAIKFARESDEPVVFITSNNYMPPLRAFGRAEDFWQASHFFVKADEVYDAYCVWEAYCEAFDSALNEAEVYMSSPEDDNSLYVVDLNRWSLRDEADRAGAGDLNDEWERCYRVRP